MVSIVVYIPDYLYIMNRAIRDAYIQIRLRPWCVGMRLVQTNSYNDGRMWMYSAKRNFEKQIVITSCSKMDDSVLYTSTGVQCRCKVADVVKSQMNPLNIA